MISVLACNPIQAMFDILPLSKKLIFWVCGPSVSRKFGTEANIQQYRMMRAHIINLFITVVFSFIWTVLQA